MWNNAEPNQFFQIISLLIAVIGILISYKTLKVIEDQAR